MPASELHTQRSFCDYRGIKAATREFSRVAVSVPVLFSGDLFHVRDNILCGDVGIVIPGAVFGQAQSVGDHIVQFLISLRGFEADGFLGTVHHAGITADAAVVPHRALIGHGDVPAGTDLFAQTAAHAAVRGEKALVVVLLYIDKGHHHPVILASGDGGHFGILVGLPGSDLLAELLCPGIGIGHHQLGSREGLVSDALACHAAQGLAIVQPGAFFPEDGIHGFKAPAVYAHIGGDHKGIRISADGEFFSEILHGFGDIPFVYGAEKAHHIRIRGKVTFGVLLYGNDGGTAHFLGNDPCGSQTVTGTAEAVNDFFHSVLNFLMCYTCNLFGCIV